MPKNQDLSQKTKSKKVKQKPQVQASAQAAPQAAAVAYSTKNRTKNAEISYSKDGRVCHVKHRERFATILGSVAFASNAYVINPGQSATFPWLSGIANRFESYSFDELQFEFRTKTATTALGDVILAVDYDATDAAPSDSIQAEAYDESASGAPWQNVTHVCKKVNLKKLPMFFVRGDTQPASTDLKMSDMGNLFVCTENQASAALVGYMYVSYSVRFFTPQLRSNDIQISGGLCTGATSMTAALPFGTAGAFDAQARGVSEAASTNSVFTFTNPGSYILTVDIVGTGLVSGTRTDGSGCSSSRFGYIVNAAGTVLVEIYTVVTTQANATWTYQVTGTTVTGSYLFVGSAPYGALAMLEEAMLSSDLSKEGCIRRLMRLNSKLGHTPCPSGCWCSRH